MGLGGRKERMSQEADLNGEPMDPLHCLDCTMLFHDFYSAWSTLSVHLPSISPKYIGTLRNRNY